MGRGGEGGGADQLGAAVLRGKLYAVGGNDKHYNDRNMVEAFDPAANKWTAVAIMLTQRCE